MAHCLGVGGHGEHVFDETQAFSTLLTETKCGGKGVHSRRREPPEARISNLLQSVSGCSKNVPWWWLCDDPRVTKNDFCTNHTVSLTLLITLSSSEVKWPGLIHPEFFADPLHVAGVWLFFFFLRIKIAFFLADGKNQYIHEGKILKIQEKKMSYAFSIPRDELNFLMFWNTSFWVFTHAHTLTKMVPCYIICFINIHHRHFSSLI